MILNVKYIVSFQNKMHYKVAKISPMLTQLKQKDVINNIKRMYVVSVTPRTQTFCISTLFLIRTLVGRILNVRLLLTMEYLYTVALLLLLK